jgi:hypothetical protein
LGIEARINVRLLFVVIARLVPSKARELDEAISLKGMGIATLGSQ